jgi:protein-tyrosine phosphatase
MSARNEVLFVCTGNYYRSRFAEAVFNHHAELRGLAARAVSRGLETFRIVEALHGALSPLTVTALAVRAIDRRHTGPSPTQLVAEDFAAAARIVALDEREHRPMIAQAFPEQLARVTFWSVPDLPYCTPVDALARIEGNVLALLAQLASPASPASNDGPGSGVP